MLFHTYDQARVFLGMLYAGIAIGVWYDALRLVRGLLDAGKWLTAALDAVFALGAACILIGFMLLANYGELRLYCLLGASCGVMLYAFTIGPLLKAVLVKPSAWVLARLRKLFSMPWAKKVFR